MSLAGLPSIRMQDLQTCADCGGSINPFFYRVTVEHCGIDQRNTRRQMGIVDFLGGNMGLAEVFFTDDTGARVVGGETIFLCQGCYLKNMDLVGAVEKSAGKPG